MGGVSGGVGESRGAVGDGSGKDDCGISGAVRESQGWGGGQWSWWGLEAPGAVGK